MKILLTGFEPFDNSTTNPSAEILKAFPDDHFPGHTIHKQVLPVDSSSAAEQVIKTLSELQPDIIFLLGEASSRPRISLEKVAINWMDFRIADNTGAQIQDQRIIEEAPDAYFSSLPLRQIYEIVKASGIPVEISLSAGAYLCNQVFFSTMHALTTLKPDTICGFIHVPSLPEQIVMKNLNAASMSKETSLEAIVVALQTCLQVLSQ